MRLWRYLENILLHAWQEPLPDPEADFISAVALGQVQGRLLSLEEMVSMVRLLLFGGFDTTAFKAVSPHPALARGSSGGPRGATCNGAGRA